MEMNYEKTIMCAWCIEGDSSHGEEIFVGHIVPTWENKKCESCGGHGEEVELYNVIVERWE